MPQGGLEGVGVERCVDGGQFAEAGRAVAAAARLGEAEQPERVVVVAAPLGDGGQPASSSQAPSASAPREWDDANDRPPGYPG
jgi:hypothetical protein